MDCTEARTHLLDRRRGTLGAELRARVDAHLAECQACHDENAADRELGVALEKRLPQGARPKRLRGAIEGKLGVRAKSRVPTFAVAACVLAAAAALLFFFGRDRSSTDALYAEAVNDHLRVLYAEHPVEIESGGVHQVKPWFAGRLDFAPVLAFGGDDDFPLQGGAIAYFVDRKAAAFEFRRRLHPITLFVFRADGLPWPGAPSASSVSLGNVRATEQTTRGFHVLLWRDGDLGYALVSDLDPRELETLGKKNHRKLGKRARRLCRSRSALRGFLCFADFGERETLRDWNDERALGDRAEKRGQARRVGMRPNVMNLEAALFRAGRIGDDARDRAAASTEFEKTLGRRTADGVCDGVERRQLAERIVERHDAFDAERLRRASLRGADAPQKLLRLEASP